MAIEKSFIEDIDKKNLLPARLIRGYEIGLIEEIIVPPEGEQYPDFCFLGLKEIEGSPFFKIGKDKIPLFADREITYQGQPIFIASHPDPRILKELCDRFEIKIAPSKKQKNSQPRIHKEIIYSKGVDRIFNSAQEILEKTYQTGVQNHYALGHQGAAAIPNKEGIAIIAPTEWNELVETNVADALKIPQKKVSFQSSKRTPAFGTKCWYPALIATQVALLAQKTQKGVRLLFSKEEDILQTTRRSPYQITIKTALKNNEIIAHKLSIKIAGGAYPVFSTPLLEIIEKSIAFLYKKIPVAYKISILETSHSSLDFFSGSGLAPLFFAIERQMDEIANFLKVSPLSLRENYIHPSFFETRLKILIDHCKKNSDYQRKQIAYDQQNKLYYSQPDKALQTLQHQRGIGIALAWQGNSPEQKEFPEFLFDRTLITRQPQKEDKNETLFKFLTFGAACAEVSINPISLEIIPQQFSIALEVPPQADRKQLTRQILKIIMPVLRWITINQNLNLNNDYPELTIPFPRRLPKINIDFFESKTAVEQGLPDLIFNLLPPAFASAASQALDQSITKLPLLVEDFTHLKETTKQGEKNGI